MNTTPSGIPYIEDTDPMDTIPSIIQAFAEKVEELMQAKGLA